MYLSLYFNFLTIKPIRMVQITNLWLNEDISAQNYLLCEFFRLNGQKSPWWKSCSFLALLPWFFWSLFDVSFHLRLNLINLGKLQCSFDVGEAATPPRTWQGFQTSPILGLNEKNSIAKIWQISWQIFSRKLVFLNFHLFTFL